MCVSLLLKKGAHFQSSINSCKGNMSLSSFSASDDFSSASGESTGRVVREEDHPDSKSSSATPSCMNDSKWSSDY